MRRIGFGRVLAAVAVLGLTVVAASADEMTVSAKAKLTGFQESPPKLTNGTGSFHATVSGGTLSYTLTYSGLSSPAVAAHIHFAQTGVNGSVFLFLCGGNGTPPCPAGGGTVSGTVTAAAILSVPSQNITAGDLAGAIRILLSGDAYVNVHTTNFPGGEIRGQVKAEDDSSD